MKTIFVTATLFLAMASAVADETLVRRMDYDAPASWHVKKVLGRDLYWKTGPDSKSWMRDGWTNAPHLAMLEHVWFADRGWFGVNDLVEGMNLKKPKYPCRPQWSPQGPDSRFKWKGDRDRTWSKYPAKFTDLLEKSWLKGEQSIREFLSAYPDHPMTGWCPDLRPILYLKPSFDTDHADYEAWKQNHPSWLGFDGYCEFDGEIAGHSHAAMEKLREKAPPELYARIVRDFPPTDDPRVLNDYIVMARDRISSFYFGETNLACLVSNNPGRFFTASRAGGVFYNQFEAAFGTCAGSWTHGGMGVRGCSRTYDQAYGWYLATYMHKCYTRDGKNEPGDLQWPYGKAGSRTAKYRPYHGAPRSLLNRSAFYGLMIGSVTLAMEKWPDFFHETETPDDFPRPSQYMLDFNRIFEINREIDRGFPYTPVAILSSLDEPYNRSNYTPYNQDKYSLLAFYNTLIPMRVKHHEDRYFGGHRQEGDIGCFWNSEFGDICDLQVSDADLEPAKFLKALSAYKAAFLVGYFNKDHFDHASIANYVKGGGTLICDAEKIAKGFVTPEMAGVTFETNKTPCANDVCAASGRVAAFPFSEPYAYHKGTATTAKPHLVDANGGVIAWANDCGKGRVITCAVDRMLPEALNDARLDHSDATFTITSNRRTFPIIAHFLREVQRETMPVTVEGDILWGVNKVEKVGGGDGQWLVWLINNKGVTKFAGEPEELDHKFDANVRVTDKKTGKVYEKLVPAGGYGWIEIK